MGFTNNTQARSHAPDAADRHRESNGYHYDAPGRPRGISQSSHPGPQLPPLTPMQHPLPPSSPTYRSRPSAAPTETPNVSTPSHMAREPCADPEQPPARSANPMSMSNLLSDSGPSEPLPPPPPVAAPPARRSPELSREAVKPYLAPHPAPISVPDAYPAPAAPAAAPVIDNTNIKRERNGDIPPVAPPVSTTTYPTGPPGLTVEATEAAYAEIEAADMSDIEVAGFEGPMAAWATRSAKRMVEIEQKELGKRKV